MIKSNEQDARQNSSDSYVIEVNDLKKHFRGKRGMEDVKAVDGISFRIQKGEFFGLLGPNGAGKTTTISILTGNQTPTEGTATIGGYDVRKEIRSVKQLIGVCPQDPSVYKFLTGMDNIKFFGNLYGMSKSEIIERGEKLLKMLDLYDARNRNAKGYSGGMLRQLNVIIALINNPEILFLDEPTVGMDPKKRRSVWNFLHEIKGTEKTVILTSHDIEEAEALCDRVAIID